jgi:hypothetical protein
VYERNATIERKTTENRVSACVLLTEQHYNRDCCHWQQNLAMCCVAVLQQTLAMCCVAVMQLLLLCASNYGTVHRMRRSASAAKMASCQSARPC